ncbi:MAG: PepSY-associated TM helix domain-containing protein [Gemmataceae bacterium]
MKQAQRVLLKWSRSLHVYLTLFGFVLLLFFAITGFMLNHEDWFLPRQATEGTIPTEWLRTPEEQEKIVEKLQGDFGVQGDLELFEPSADSLRVVFKADDDGVTRRSVTLIRRVDGLATITPESSSSRERIRISEGTIAKELLVPDDAAKQLPIVEALRRDFGARGEVNVAPRYEKESESFQVTFRSPGYLGTATIRASDGHTRVVHQSRGVAGIMLDLHRGKDSGATWSVVIDGLAVLFVIVSITGLILWTSLKARAQHGLAILLVGTVLGFAVYYATVPR